MEASIIVAKGAYSFDNSYLQYLGWLVQSVKKKQCNEHRRKGLEGRGPTVGVDSRCVSFVATLCGKYKGKEVLYEVFFHKLSNGPKSSLACKIQQLQNRVQETRVLLSI